MLNCVGCDEEPGSIKIQSSILTTKMFSEITGIKVKSDYSICKQCQNELKQCYSFRKRVLEIHSLYGEDNTTLVDSRNEHVEQVFIAEISHVKQETEVVLEEKLDDFDNEESWNGDNFEEYEDENKVAFVDEAQLEEKEEKSEENPRFKCQYCSRKFPKRSAKATHELSHLNLRDFKCPRSGCNSAFNVLYRLLRHMRNVHSIEEHEIEAFKEKHRSNAPVQPLPRETKSKATNEKNRVQCEICLKVLSNVKYLKEHLMLQHLDNAPYVCEKKDCGKKFTDWSLLEKHQLKHEGKFEHQCNYCQKGFVQRKTLNQHLKKSHQISQEEIEKIQKSCGTCAECGLTFKTSQKLSEHKAFSHGNGNVLICDLCGKLFFSRVMLISHQKYHQGTEKKKCLKCPSTFTEEKGLKTHMRRVHKMSEVEIFDIFMKL